MRDFSEKDWKVFRKKLPVWQEKYMDKLIQEYASILSSHKLPSEKFRELYERINKDCRDTGVQARMSRSMMFDNLLSLIGEKAIEFDDLEEFSQELKDKMKKFFPAKTSD